jgi:hypothetical protein
LKEVDFGFDTWASFSSDSFSGEFPPNFIKNVIADAKVAFEKWTKLPSVQDVTRYPPQFPENFEVAHSLCVFRPDDPASPQTLFFQGWMFDGEVQEGRMGISRYPLIGCYNPTGFVSLGEFSSGSELSEFCPLSFVSPADQHAHLVEEVLELDGFSMTLRDWHFGGPMAKLAIDAEFRKKSDVATGLAVCVDVERKRIHVCALFIVCGNLPQSQVLDKDFLASRSTAGLKGFVESLPNFDPSIGF